MQTTNYTQDSPVLSLTVAEFKDLVAQAARAEVDSIVALGDRWQGGELILQPGKNGLQEKRVPIEDFFKKIVILRDRLRVLEQKVNSHATLTAADKVELQQYVTRCYGSLTTFNLLFKYREDQFKGVGGQV
jgi:hypothetical protein